MSAPRPARMLLAVGALTAAACGSGGPGPAPDLAGKPDLRDVVEQLRERPPAQFTVIVEQRAAPGSDAPRTARAAGRVDGSTGATEIRLEGTLAGLMGDQFAPGVGVEELVIVTDGDELFITGPSGLVADPDGVAKIDLTDMAHYQVSGLFGPSVPIPGTTPVALADLLEHVEGVMVAPDSRVGDVPTAVLTARLDLSAAFDQMREDPVIAVIGYYAPGLDLSSAGALDIDDVIEVEVHVDGDGALRRIVQRFDAGAIDEAIARDLNAEDQPSPPVPTVITVDLDDHGGSEDVELPESGTDVTGSISDLTFNATLDLIHPS